MAGFHEHSPSRCHFLLGRLTATASDGSIRRETRVAARRRRPALALFAIFSWIDFGDLAVRIKPFDEFA